MRHMTAAQVAESQGDGWESGGEDWPNAYRHSPMGTRSPSGAQLHSSISLVGPPRLSGLWRLAVTSFNRFSRLVESLAGRLVYALCTLYFDDATDWRSSKGSGQWALNEHNKVLGTPLCCREAPTHGSGWDLSGSRPPSGHGAHRRSCSALGSRALAGEADGLHPRMPG